VFAAVIISGDRYQFSAESEQEKAEWMQMLQDASRISVRPVGCYTSDYR